MIEYYQKRAAEYELVYQKPERQAELRRLEAWARSTFRNERVLEIACGTGYWTQFIAQSAHSVMGVDVNAEVIQLAQKKEYARQNVEFRVADLNGFQPGVRFDALFGGFIWSHIGLRELSNFVKQCQAWVKTGGRMVFLDNQFVEGSSTPIARWDEEGNSFQLRSLENREQFEVMKNFPSEAGEGQMLEGMGFQSKWTDMEYYWLIELWQDK